jgi:hypothetical protein
MTSTGGGEGGRKWPKNYRQREEATEELDRILGRNVLAQIAALQAKNAEEVAGQSGTSTVCSSVYVEGPTKTHAPITPPWVGSKKGSRSPMGWWFGLASSTLEFWVRFPNERNQGKQVHPVLK